MPVFFSQQSRNDQTIQLQHKVRRIVGTCQKFLLRMMRTCTIWRGIATRQDEARSANQQKPLCRHNVAGL
jgi:hypothetical protein